MNIVKMAALSLRSNFFQATQEDKKRVKVHTWVTKSDSVVYVQKTLTVGSTESLFVERSENLDIFWSSDLDARTYGSILDKI